jgi:hypothetical protein
MIKYTFAVMAIMFCLASLTIGLAEEPRGESKEVARPTLEEARRQAEILHGAIHSTLHVVHQRLYKEDEGLPIPAAVLKEVFADLETEQKIKLRWLAVEGQPMNSDHKPKDPFENEAVKALSSGQQTYERTENGVYRRAGSIKLTNPCLKCHVPNRKSLEDRTAGLIITIPIKDK